MASEKHFKTGDAEPSLPNNDGKLRILSNRFCPFAQRLYLVLETKQIPYHTININLKHKPEWLTQYSPLGKVPALGLVNEPGTPYIYESLIVVDYLDEKYPQQKLYPNDVLLKTQDRLWINQFEAIVQIFYRCLKGAYVGGDGTSDAFADLSKGLVEYDAELKRRGTVYFGGDKQPGMLDYMIWPWFERFELFKYTDEGKRFELDPERFATLLSWTERMVADRAVQKRYLSGEVHYRLVKEHFKGGDIDYDLFLSEENII